jgi:hypothetical protein
VVGLHRVLQNGDSDGVVHRRGAEAAAEAEADGLRAYGAHGAGEERSTAGEEPPRESRAPARPTESLRASLGFS